MLEFTAPEGNCYVPFWMMQNLMLEEGGVLSVKNVSLPKATFVKFKRGPAAPRKRARARGDGAARYRPQSTDFLDISNPRAVLEKQFRTFSCLTVGDQICLPRARPRPRARRAALRPRRGAGTTTSGSTSRSRR